MTNRLLLIDGNAIMHRAYHAIPPFKTKSGIQTNAIYGFFSILNKAVLDYKPDHLIVCFDTPVPTFRKKLFKEYQSHRPKMETELSSQFQPVKEGLDAAHIAHIEKEGFEADDVIGTISHIYSKNGDRVLILSGDRDILQLVNERIFVITPQLGFGKEKLYDRESVIERFGIPPDKIPDFKALMGDSSDNYKGAKGIGPKTAAKLLKEYGTVESVLSHINKIDGRIAKMLSDHIESVRISHELATILTNLQINFSIDSAKFIGFHEQLKDFMSQYEMHSLVNRIFPKVRSQSISNTTKNKKTISNQNQIELF